MGTSSMYKGPKDNKLLPDDYTQDDNNEKNEGLDNNIEKMDAWKKTKNAMSKFANSNRGNKKNVMKKYANANGGSSRMSKSAASGIKGVSALGGLLTKISNSGFDNTMREYNIDYKNKSMDTIFSEFINILSPEANTKEETSAREAMIQTLSELYEILERTGEDLQYFEKLDDNKFNFIINKYIENYIFTKFLNDLEYRFEKYADNIDKVIQKEKDIRDFIKYSVNNTTKNINFKNFDYNDLKSIENIYKDCYEVWEE